MSHQLNYTEQNGCVLNVLEYSELKCAFVATVCKIENYMGLIRVICVLIT